MLRNLLSGGLDVGDQISALVGLLETSEDHLGAGDVFLRVLEVLEQGIFVPGDSLLDVGFGVRESGSLASFAAHDAAQVGSDLVFAASFNGVALSASLDENLLSLFNVTGWNSHL